MNDQKLFGGPRVRRLRKDRGLTQARMADELGISASYLNLIERNQRPLTAQILVRLAESYDIDFRSFAGNDEAHALAGLQEVFSDPLFEAYDLGLQDLKDLAGSNPEASQAIVTLYQAYREGITGAAELAERLADTDKTAGLGGTPRFPGDTVREFLHAQDNHFAGIESAAEDFHERAGLARDELYHGLRSYLAETLGIGVNVVPSDVLPTTLRLFDHHRRRVLLSEMLPVSGRVFQLAYQIAVLEHGALLDDILEAGRVKDPQVRRLTRVNLANYFAGAVMMPYDRFLTAAESARYDIDILSQRFDASFEQICHRLTTMQRSGARGVPFFMMRVDNAGNISKRFSAGGFQFARLGGACPRWNVHHAFQTPGKIFTQMVQMPDGAAYFSVARTVNRTGAGFHVPEQQLAVGLGCEISQARRLVYADGFDTANAAAATPIGINCRLCERTDCNQRAFPPINRPMIVDERRRDVSPFVFAVD